MSLTTLKEVIRKIASMLDGAVRNMCIAVACGCIQSAHGIIAA